MECFRRIALTGIAVFIYPDSSAQIAVVLLLAAIFMVVSEILSPFSRTVEMCLYRVGQYVVFASMYLALLLRVDISGEQTQSQEVFSGVLVIAHAAMFLVVLAQGLLIFIGWGDLVEPPDALKGLSGNEETASDSGNLGPGEAIHRTSYKYEDDRFVDTNPRWSRNSASAEEKSGKTRKAKGKRWEEWERPAPTAKNSFFPSPEGSVSSAGAGAGAGVGVSMFATAPSAGARAGRGLDAVRAARSLGGGDAGTFDAKTNDPVYGRESSAPAASTTASAAAAAAAAAAFRKTRGKSLSPKRSLFALRGNSAAVTIVPKAAPPIANAKRRDERKRSAPSTAKSSFFPSPMGSAAGSSTHATGLPAGTRSGGGLDPVEEFYSTGGGDGGYFEQPPPKNDFVAIRARVKSLSPERFGLGFKANAAAVAVAPTQETPTAKGRPEQRGRPTPTANNNSLFISPVGSAASSSAFSTAPPVGARGERGSPVDKFHSQGGGQTGFGGVRKNGPVVLRVTAAATTTAAPGLMRVKSLSPKRSLFALNASADDAFTVASKQAAQAAQGREAWGRPATSARNSLCISPEGSIASSSAFSSARRIGARDGRWSDAVDKFHTRGSGQIGFSEARKDGPVVVRVAAAARGLARVKSLSPKRSLFALEADAAQAAKTTTTTPKPRTPTAKRWEAWGRPVLTTRNSLHISPVGSAASSSAFSTAPPVGARDRRGSDPVDKLHSLGGGGRGGRGEVDFRGARTSDPDRPAMRPTTRPAVRPAAAAFASRRARVKSLSPKRSLFALQANAAAAAASTATTPKPRTLVATSSPFFSSPGSAVRSPAVRSPAVRSRAVRSPAVRVAAARKTPGSKKMRNARRDFGDDVIEGRSVPKMKRTKSAGASAPGWNGSRATPTGSGGRGRSRVSAATAAARRDRTPSSGALPISGFNTGGGLVSPTVARNSPSATATTAAAAPAPAPVPAWRVEPTGGTSNAEPQQKKLWTLSRPYSWANEKDAGVGSAMFANLRDEARVERRRAGVAAGYGRATASIGRDRWINPTFSASSGGGSGGSAEGVPTVWDVQPSAAARHKGSKRRKPSMASSVARKMERGHTSGGDGGSGRGGGWRRGGRLSKITRSASQEPTSTVRRDIWEDFEHIGSSDGDNAETPDRNRGAVNPTTNTQGLA